MSDDKLRGAKRAPITYYSGERATGKVVTRWVEPPEGYSEAGVITMFPGAMVRGGYQENLEKRKVLKGEVSLNYQGTKKLTPESKMLCVERAYQPTYHNYTKEVVEIYFKRKIWNKK